MLLAALYKNKIEIVDVGLILLAVPDERRRGGERGVAETVGDVEIIMVHARRNWLLLVLVLKSQPLKAPIVPVAPVGGCALPVGTLVEAM